MNLQRLTHDFKKKIITSLLIQGSGSALQLLLTVILTTFGGLYLQGVFIEKKSLFDLLVAVGCLGLPQGLLINDSLVKSRLTLLNIYWLSFFYPLFFSITLYLAFQLINIKYVEFNLYLALATSFLITREVWRGLFIHINDGIAYSFFTIIPSIFMFISMLSSLLFKNTAIDVTFYFFIASTSSIIISMIVFKPPIGIISLTIIKKIDYLKIIKPSSDSFIQAFFFNFQIFIIYYLINKFSGSKNEVGAFSILLTIYQISFLPIQFLSPLLITSIKNKTKSFAFFQKKISKIYILILTPALLITFLIPSNYYHIIGYDKYVIIIMEFSILLTIYSRLYNLFFFINSFSYSNSYLSIIRAISLVTFFHLLSNWDFSILLIATLSWLLSEATTLLCSIIIFLKGKNENNLYK